MQNKTRKLQQNIWDTIIEKLHAKGKFALEGIDLVTFFFEARKQVFKLFNLVSCCTSLLSFK